LKTYIHKWEITHSYLKNYWIQLTCNMILIF
jgi:hypothetical protein